ncbi:MAG: hypothetical protein MUC87_06910 [Bacteroidia bacterium]|jgi:hypothetical protein|nr:hypothetical protein [Bacteroidia bacterium]
MHFLRQFVFYSATFLLLTSVASCKRETLPEQPQPTEPTLPVEYSVTFKLDGVEQTYIMPNKTVFITPFDPTTTSSSFSFVAMRDTALIGQNHIYLTLNDTVPLTTNLTYTNYTTTQLNERGLLNFDFRFIYYTADGEMTFTIDEALQTSGIVSDARLILTEVTPEYVRGRFSGTVYGIPNNLPMHIITDGVFTMGRIY